MDQQHLDKICAHFKVRLTEITKLTEWHNVFHVVVKGIGSRFISKAVVYNQGDHRLFNKFRTLDSSKWCLYNLKFLNRLQLRSLCCLLGIESNGTRKNISARIKNTVEVMAVLTPYTDEIYQFTKHYKPCDPDDLTIPLTVREINKRFIKQHKAKELRTLCNQIGLCSDRIPQRESKQQLSHKLFSWFNNCLVRREIEFQAAITLSKKAYA